VADITSILGKDWSPPEPPNRDPPDVQIKDAMLKAGIVTLPATILMDGNLHRFSSGTKGAPGKSDKPGWYIFHQDVGGSVGSFGCWRSGISINWHEDIGRVRTIAEEMAHSRRLSEAKVARDAAHAREQEATEGVIDAIWSGGTGATPDHPYLARKGIQPHGARVTGDGRLMVPLYDSYGALSSIQYIQHSGDKLYHAGAPTKGAFWMVGTMDNYHTLYIAEGFATAATIHETTGQPCIVAFSASNLPDVAQTFKDAKNVIIVADNDEHGVGMNYATQASAKTGCAVVEIPIVKMDANDYLLAGHDLLALLQPVKDQWLIPADEFCSSPAPIRWLVKHWIQSDALLMIHGPSGGGKTFVALDWCLHVAAGLADWNNNKVRAGSVVYLAGEGHHGLRGRIAAWKQDHPEAGKLSMWLSRAGCNLNTGPGYTKVASSIRDMDIAPSLIVVDTLHRFLEGDENSAQDAKTMLDACSLLMRDFNCTVLLVHHTGVSDEAQHRARGSSAWKGALDGEISIVPGKDGRPIEIIQRKMKDTEEAQPIYAILKSIPISGWVDEDGEPVTSAVLEISEAPSAAIKESPWRKHLKTFERAWFASECEEREGMPYVSRSALQRFLVINEGLSEGVASSWCNPANATNLISILLSAEILSAFDHGWIVVNNTEGSALMMRKLS